ncbi:hypothetical protein Efla_003504 [Eimeria flavescens]
MGVRRGGGGPPSAALGAVRLLAAAAAAAAALGCCLQQPLLPLAAAAAAAPGGEEKGGAPSSLPTELLSGLLDSWGAGGAEGLPDFQSILQKLSSKPPANTNSSGSTNSASQEGKAKGLLAELMSELPRLPPSLLQKAGEAMKGAGGFAAASRGLQQLTEKVIESSGEDAGLLKHFRSLHALSAQGLSDLGGLASAFKGLSAALEQQGTDLNSLMGGLLDGPLVEVPPLAVPASLRKRYKRGPLKRPFQDRQGTDITRPPAVSLSVIRAGIATRTEQLPAAAAAAAAGGGRGGECHALVLSGALARAPLQAGALLGLVEQYKARKQPLRWDVVAAVNKGALSAAMSLAFPPGENDELEWALSLWDFWQRMRPQHFLRCPHGLKDLMNLPRILSWLTESSEAVNKMGVKPSRLPLPHACEVGALAETLGDMLQQLPSPDEAPAEAAAAAGGAVGRGRRVVVMTAAAVGGGMGVWEATGVGSTETCLPRAVSSSLSTLGAQPTCPLQQEDASLSPWSGAYSLKSEQDLLLAVLLASNATPGVYPLLRAPELLTLKGAGLRFVSGDTREKQQQQQRQQRPAAPAEPPRKETGAFADGRLVADLSVEQAIHACMSLLTTEEQEEGEVKKIQRGKGITLDLIGTAPFDSSEVEEQLLAIAAQLNITSKSGSSSSRSGSGSGLSPRQLLQQIKKKYPLLSIRHVLFPEEAFDLMSDYADFRSSEALLHHGRLMGWKATTYEDTD